MMSRVTGAVKAAYNFFSGDAIILGAVALTFTLGEILARATDAPNEVVAVVFVGIIVAGLTTSLGREVRGRRLPRRRRSAR
jgi:hypothetical protein